MRAYGEISLPVTSPNSDIEEPISLDDAKSYLRVSNTAEDDLIELMITAARKKAELETHLELAQKQWDLNLDVLLGYDGIAGAAYPLRFNTTYNFGADYGIDLKFPLKSVDLFTTTDYNGVTTQLTEGINSDYRVDLHRARVVPAYGKSWPFYQPDVSSSVLIRFTSGYTTNHPFWSDEGSNVKIAMYLLISAWHQNRVPFDPTLRGDVIEYPFAVTEMLKSAIRSRVF